MSGDPWMIDELEFPETGSVKEQLVFLIRYAILAPSTYNSQPWRFGIRGSEIDIYADRGRWLRVIDKTQRELYISVGCAIENLTLAAHRFKRLPYIDYFPNPDQNTLAATVRIEPAEEFSENTILFDSIKKRATNYEPFGPRLLEPDLIEHLRQCVLEEDLQLFIMTEDSVRAQIQELVAKTNAQLYADPAYRAELGHWVGQGVFGTPWWMSKVGELALTYLDFGSFTATKDAERVASAPGFGIIVAPVNDRATQVRVGRLYERLALYATHLGLGMQPMSQLLEVPESKEALTALLPEAAWIPQLPFRIGFATQEMAHTPRRPLEEVLL